MEVYLNLDEFLEFEKKRIRAEKQRLCAIPVSGSLPENATSNSSANDCNRDQGDVDTKSLTRQIVQVNDKPNEIKGNRSSMIALNTSGIEQQENADQMSLKVNDLPPPTTPNAESSVVLYANANESSGSTKSFHKTEETKKGPLPIETLHNQENKITGKLEAYKESEEKELNYANVVSIKEEPSSHYENAPNKKIENMSKDEVLEKGWSKIEKDKANRKELESTSTNIQQRQTSTSNVKDKRKPGKHEDGDDMDQWVSDTFYSYFPGFNNEYQKRQNYLRERQLEYQQNLLKHQQEQQQQQQQKQQQQQHLTPPRPVNFTALQDDTLTLTANSLGTPSPHSTSNTSIINKTDLEIIVNNPNYAPKFATTTTTTPRPGTTRHKLLQDLRHTELSNMIAGDGVMERNRHTAETELARKKDYQRELMQQIEEKRRSIEFLQEQERRQEEALTKRLQEQLKTIKLEEDLEKERLRVEKLRFNTQQNRTMREHLLAKLENDTRLLYEQKPTTKQLTSQRRSKEETQSVETGEQMSSVVCESSHSSRIDDTDSKNKVYKYFSNSARREYRCGQPLPTANDSEFDWDRSVVESSSCVGEERECFHLSEKVCPLCEGPLKNYESCCLRCQRQLSIRFKKTNNESSKVGLQDGGSGKCLDSYHHNGDGNGKHSVEDDILTSSRSYSLVCSKCERLYSLCSNCVLKRDVCRACHRQRNVCMNCRRTLCSFCLEEIASGRDVERFHINDLEKENNDERSKVSPSSLKKHDNVDSDDGEPSFHILEVKHAKQKMNNGENKASTQPTISARSASFDIVGNNYNSCNNNNNYNNYNNSNNYKRNNNKIINKHAPYSFNIERNSIFHPNYEPLQQQQQTSQPLTPKSLSPFEQFPKLSDTNLSLDFNSTQDIDENANLERIRKETDKRLMRYLKNYGDLAKFVSPVSKGSTTCQQRQQRSQSESHDRSTQTTPLSVARRDVVLHEEHNLSMPLLREMPRMTRKEAQIQQKSVNKQIKNKNDAMDNLKIRWEVPAVQKHTISKSPPVLTQVGCMRKELQTERIMSENY